MDERNTVLTSIIVLYACLILWYNIFLKIFFTWKYIKIICILFFILVHKKILKNIHLKFFSKVHITKSYIAIFLNERLALLFNLLFGEFQIFFFCFLLKLSVVCTFWIVLMCWYQKWFLKNKKTSLACISARKAIWKATTTTLPNTL